MEKRGRVKVILIMLHFLFTMAIKVLNLSHKGQTVTKQGKTSIWFSEVCSDTDCYITVG